MTVLQHTHWRRICNTPPLFFYSSRGGAYPATPLTVFLPPMKNQLLEMKINPNDKTTFSVKIPVGSQSYGFGLLIHDFAAFELSGSEEGVELKTYRWMQEQTDGLEDELLILKAIEGWRVRMRREFLKWGKKDAPDCWEYIPVNLRLWCDSTNPSPKWREIPVLFLWRCHLWLSRLRGCQNEPKPKRIKGDPVDSQWIREYGWIYDPLNMEVIWNPKKAVLFKKVPSDVAEFLCEDWIRRLENSSIPPIWDREYSGRYINKFRFEEWKGKENWVPDSRSLKEFLVGKWKSIPDEG